MRVARRSEDGAGEVTRAKYQLTFEESIRTRLAVAFALELSSFSSFGIRHLTGCSVTSVGRVTVKIEPLPYSLVTVKSPPIICAHFRESASPSPVPPYFFEVEASACVKA